MTSEERVYTRVARMIDDMLDEQAIAICEVKVPARTLTRIRHDCHNMKLQTLIRVCDALGYDLILNARKR